jgi:hypothetical protein
LRAPGSHSPAIAVKNGLAVACAHPFILAAPIPGSLAEEITNRDQGRLGFRYNEADDRARGQFAKLLALPLDLESKDGSSS